MNKSDSRIRKIVLAVWMNGAAGRDILSGILRFVKTRPHWRLRILPLPDNFSPALLDNIIAAGIDGIITSDDGLSPVARLISESSAAIVCIGATIADGMNRSAPTAIVSCDDREIGKLGAKKLYSLGEFSSFGFVCAGPNITWSNERQAGFAAELAKHGRRCELFQPDHTLSDWNLDQEQLGLWAESLPKPAAVMASFDYHAIQFLNVCRERNVKIPQQVCVLGVDNDELLCDFSDPPLSSIRPDHERAGYLAAMELDKLMCGRKSRKNIVSPLKGIVERDTTHFIAPSANLVRRALAFIERETPNGISVQDVVRHLGVSRRLADLRFREVQSHSILEEITSRRLAIASDLLATSDYPISRIARFSGYRNVKTFEIAFRKAFGSPPSAMSHRRQKGAGVLPPAPCASPRVVYAPTTVALAD